MIFALIITKLMTLDYNYVISSVQDGRMAENDCTTSENCEESEECDPVASILYVLRAPKVLGHRGHGGKY